MRADHLHFPAPLSSQTPWDVDTALQHQLTGEGKFAEVQRLFEVLSWQAFVALNWPADTLGQPRPQITDAGEPVWFGWKEVFEVYKSDGSRPTPPTAPCLPCPMPSPTSRAADRYRPS
ncbi:MAG: hypothetical protein OHK0039_28860 [Bacteroidia bacterium]